MSEATIGPSAGEARRGIPPFAVFGVVAALAIGGAVFEMLYYVTSPGLAGAAMGTAGGIGAAVVVFFALALTAPPNE